MSTTLREISLTYPWVSTLTLFSLFSFAVIVEYLYLAPRRSPLWNLPGPESDSFLYGNFKRISASEAGVEHARLEALYGPTFRYYGMFGTLRLYSSDAKVFNHITTHAYDFPKATLMRKIFVSILGEGLLSTEGEVHKRQRRVMLPSFSAQSVRDLVPIFLEKASEMTERIMEDALEKDGTPADSVSGEKTSRLVSNGVNVLFWLGRASLDVIGLSGFDYDFNSLQDETNELAVAYKSMFEGMTKVSFFTLLQRRLPFLNIIKTKRQRTQAIALEVTTRIGQEVVAQKKQAVVDLAVKEKGGVTKTDVQGRDILSSLIRANLAFDVSDQQRLTDEEVLAQISTMLIAGFETSSTALTWMLAKLSEHPDVQVKLRDELVKVKTATPTIDELNALPYLDAVVKECLRVDPPVSNTVRVSGKDENIVPLTEPVVGRNGQLITELRLPKDTWVVIPIINLNSSDRIYGDGKTFRPERWLEPILESAMCFNVPYAHQTTFLAGPRGCIGWRFALAEIKAFLFVILRKLEFEHISPKPVYEHKSTLVQRPRIKGREGEGYQMRLVVRAVEAHEK